jgi:receptor protein-tyrosine kinase
MALGVARSLRVDRHAMKPETENLDVEYVLTVLRRRWWVIVLLTIVLGGASFALSKVQQKQYTATAAVLFQDQQLSQQASGLQVLQSSPSSDPVVMATDIQQLTQQAGVSARTAQLVGRGVTPAEVSQAISVSQQGQTNVANVSVMTTNPSLSSAIANAYVSEFIAGQRVQQQAAVSQALNLVERQIAAMSKQQLAGTTGQALIDREESLRILSRLQNGGAQILAPAKPPTAPSSPKVSRNTLLGLLIGLLLGISVAVLLERLDRRMKNVEELEAAYQLPLLAAIPHNRGYSVPPHARGPTHGDHEVFRLLRAYLRYFNVDRELRSLLVASAAPGDGKSTVARNLAQAAQETGAKTLLLEADLRRPSMSAHYAVAPAPGLSELLSGSAGVNETVRSIPIATRVNGSTAEVMLDLIPSGHAPPNPAELIESKAMSDLLSWAAEHYDLVVIDTPPLSVVSDVVSLLRKVDGVVVVSQLGKNTRDAAAFLRERLVGVNAPLLGVIANGVKSKSNRGYGYGYGYGTYQATEIADRAT